MALSSTDEDRDRAERIAAMLAREPRHASRDYLTSTTSANRRIGVARRAKICRWMTSTARRLGFQRDTAIVAVGYLDRCMSSTTARHFLSKPHSRSARETRRGRRERYQLAAVTCLHLAAKVHDPVRMDAAAMSEITRKAHSADDILRCELEVLQALRWRVHGPTSLQFVHCMLELLPKSTTPAVSKRLYEHACRQIELAVEDYACIILRRSSVALASVLNALECVPTHDFSGEDRSIFARDIAQTFQIEPKSPLIELMRKRLRERFATTSRCTPEVPQDDQHGQIPEASPSKKEGCHARQLTTVRVGTKRDCAAHLSPDCVSLKRARVVESE